MNKHWNFKEEKSTTRIYVEAFASGAVIIGMFVITIILSAGFIEY